MLQKLVEVTILSGRLTGQWSFFDKLLVAYSPTLCTDKTFDLKPKQLIICCYSLYNSQDSLIHANYNLILSEIQL